MSKKHELIFETETLTLSKGHDGFWLYDHVWGGNLGMRCKSERDAMVETIEYYQERTAELQNELNTLQKSVSEFINKVRPCEDV